LNCSDLFSSRGKGSIEPLLECAARLEDGRQQEIQQSPQLGQFVLQWGTSEQQTMWCQVMCVQDLRQFAVVILHAVTLVYDHELPSKLKIQNAHEISVQILKDDKIINGISSQISRNRRIMFIDLGF
jgi:hypothetical protein